MNLRRRSLIAAIASAALAIGIVEPVSPAIGGLLLGKPLAAAPGNGPSAFWTGVANSGFNGSIPTDATRMVAKPAIRFLNPIDQRFSGDLVVGVEAGALGGIDRIEFFIENPTAITVTNPQVFSDLNVNGQPRNRIGYFTTLTYAVFASRVPAGGSANLYARAWPSNPLFQPRTIGPLRLYPNPTLYDHSYTVATSNPDVSPNFTTIKKALNQAQLDGAQNPLITITQTGSYELENGTWTAYTTAKGYANITTAPGVTATLGRAAFPGSATNNYFWDPHYDRLHIYGSGIVIDQKNFTYINCSTSTFAIGGNHWIEGVQVINSGLDDNGLPAPYNFYWNRGVRPDNGLLVQAALVSSLDSRWAGGMGYSGGGFIEDCTLTAGKFHLVGQEMVRGNSCNFPVERWINGSIYAADNYMNKTGIAFFQNSITALRFAYSGASTVATYQKTANSATDYTSTGASVVLVDDAGTSSWGLSIYPNTPNTSTPNDGTNGVYYDLTKLIAFFAGTDATLKTLQGVDSVTWKAAHPGWSLTNILSTTNPWSGLADKITDRNAACIGGTNGTATQNIKSLGHYDEIALIDVHEGGYNIETAQENFIVTRNVGLNIDNPFVNSVREPSGYQCFYLDNGSSTDGYIVGNLWQGALVRFNVSCPAKHTVFLNNALAGAQVRFSGQTNATVTGTITGTNLLTVTAVSSGTLHVGDNVSGVGIAGIVTILSFGTGTGGTGTYNISTSANVGSETLTITAPYNIDQYCVWQQGISYGWTTAVGPLPLYPAFIDSYNGGTWGGRNGADQTQPSSYSGAIFGTGSEAAFANLIGGLAGAGRADSPPSILSNLTAGTYLRANPSPLSLPLRPWDATFTATNPAGDVWGAFDAANTVMPTRPF